jgi:hypothetical protein
MITLPSTLTTLDQQHGYRSGGLIHREHATLAPASQVAGAASIEGQPGPVYLRPELISGENAPQSIFDDPRVWWLSGRFADVAADLAQ